VVANAPAVPDGIRPARPPVAAPFVLATVGRLVPWKGVDGILDALTALPEAGLVVVGEGPGRAALETRARDLGLSPRESFAGGRSREETLGLIAGCDLFVLNSAYEGLPHVLLEAMALGRPVLAAAAGGVPEIVHHGENGWLVPVGDAAALVAALRHLAADPQERHRLGAAGQRTAAGFSLERMVAETEALLHHLTR
jgi:glycosyltransferase involved in cell wall biosynthesis